jgi:hypothetical protein
VSLQVVLAETCAISHFAFVTNREPSLKHCAVAALRENSTVFFNTGGHSVAPTSVYTRSLY